MIDEDLSDAKLISDLADAMPRFSAYRLTASQQAFFKKFESILAYIERKSSLTINEMIQ